MGCSAYFGARRGTISLQSRLRGGEGGIRTLGTGVSPYNGLANRRIRPLCHLSAFVYNKLPTSSIPPHPTFAKMLLKERHPWLATKKGISLSVSVVGMSAIMSQRLTADANKNLTGSAATRKPNPALSNS